MTTIKERLEYQLSKGLLAKARGTAKEMYEAEHKAEWNKAKQDEYEALYPTYRDMTEDEYNNTITEENRDEYFIDYSELQEIPQVTIEYITIDEEGNEVRTPENYVTFTEWLNETKVVTEGKEAVLDDDGMIIEEAVQEVTELVRPYVVMDQDTLDTKVSEYLSSRYADLRKCNYPSIEEQLDMIYHNGLDAWKAKITEVKEKYPKV
jgi:hypothetical protein